MVTALLEDGRALGEGGGPGEEGGPREPPERERERAQREREREGERTDRGQHSQNAATEGS